MVRRRSMRSLWMRLLWTFLVAVVLAGAGSARVRAEDEAAAREHYERGVALYDEGQYAASLAEFEAAYAGSHRASILFNIGQIQARLGRAVEAVEALERYLAEASAIAPERRALVETEIRTQSARIASVQVDVSVPGALVTFDDVDLGRAPLASAVRTGAGEHMVIARADGYEPARFRFRIAGGESRTVALELAPRSEDAARLRLVIGVPGADVRIDARSIGLSPVELPVSLPAGRHRVEVSRRGYEPVERLVELAAAQEHTLRVDLATAANAGAGVMTRLALALPTTSHTLRIDGMDLAPGTSTLELPYGPHDLEVEAEDMVPVRERIDIPERPTFAFDTRYQWLPAHRESMRAQASAVRMGAAITMVVGGAVGLGGGAFFLGREVHLEQSRLSDRQSIIRFCNAAPPIDEECERMIVSSFPMEGDPQQFEAITNRELGIREGLAVSGGILVGVGAAALLAGLVIFFLPPSDDQIDASTTTRPSVSLDVGPGGLSLTGTF
ncbi:MAG: PEGA domain-containing protein [Deltaproteobacteria bacterium]